MNKFIILSAAAVAIAATPNLAEAQSSSAVAATSRTAEPIKTVDAAKSEKIRKFKEYQSKSTTAGGKSKTPQDRRSVSH